MWKGHNIQTCYISLFQDSMTKIILFVFCTNTNCNTDNKPVNILESTSIFPWKVRHYFMHSQTLQLRMSFPSISLQISHSISQISAELILQWLALSPSSGYITQPQQVFKALVSASTEHNWPPQNIHNESFKTYSITMKFTSNPSHHIMSVPDTDAAEASA